MGRPVDRQTEQLDSLEHVAVSCGFGGNRFEGIGVPDDGLQDTEHAVNTVTRAGLLQGQLCAVLRQEEGGEGQEEGGEGYKRREGRGKRREGRGNGRLIQKQYQELVQSENVTLLVLYSNVL